MMIALYRQVAAAMSRRPSRLFSFVFASLVLFACGTSQAQTNEETLSKTTSSATPGYTYYSFSFHSEDDSKSFYGYANIHWTAPGSGDGTICINTGPRNDTSRLPLHIPIADAALANGVLQVKIGPNTVIPDLNNVTITLKPTDVEAFTKALPKTTTWSNSNQYLFSVYLVEIPADPEKYGSFSFNSADTQVSYNSAGDRIKFYPMSVYDHMTPQEAIRFEHKHPPFLSEGGYEPAIVQAIIDPKNIAPAEKLLQQVDKGITFEACDACGAPFVWAEIHVPPMLELYLARRLQLSGLAVTAYASPLIADPPPLAEFAIPGHKFDNLVLSGKNSLGEQDARLENYFRKLLISFLKQRRPGLIDKFVIRRPPDRHFTYRFMITGPAISACNPNIWELVAVQILLQQYGDATGVGFILQVPYGGYAGGSLENPPPEARLQETKMTDAMLMDTQNAIGTFLIDRRFDDLAETKELRKGDIVCKERT
jgi:hypothetical protein